MPLIWRDPRLGGLTPEEQAEADAWAAGIEERQERSLARQGRAAQRDWLAPRSRSAASIEDFRREVEEQRVGSSSTKPEIAFRPHNPPRYEVRLAGGARHTMQQELVAWAPYHAESGGLLYSP